MLTHLLFYLLQVIRVDSSSPVLTFGRGDSCIVIIFVIEVGAFRVHGTTIEMNMYILLNPF